MKPHVLVARLDSLGDLLLQGPAVRAVAAGARRVTLLCGPIGLAAAELLPGVDATVVFKAGWIHTEPIRRLEVLGLVEQITDLRPDVGVILTSYPQSPLPLALLLRLAGVERLGGITEERAGSLLDVRLEVDEDIHEVERSLALTRALGFTLPAGDDARLRVRRPGTLPREVAAHRPYVVVHPGASAPTRAWSPDHHARLVRLLVDHGRRVVVTGGLSETGLTAFVTGQPQRAVMDLGGKTDLADLAEVLAAAEVMVSGDTGVAHLGAAVGTSIVSLFAPVTPAACWRPWGVPHVLLGKQDAPCAGRRGILVCPVPAHPCLDSVSPEQVIGAVEELAARRQPSRPDRSRIRVVE